jgi:23S rRNA-/tRNA-specific pseudouridylate synthase
MKQKERRIIGLYVVGGRLRGNLRACRRLGVKTAGILYLAHKTSKAKWLSEVIKQLVP